eukprot:8228696-Alexandrium_andersonii.AAC.1
MTSLARAAGCRLPLPGKPGDPKDAAQSSSARASFRRNSGRRRLEAARKISPATSPEGNLAPGS